MEIEYRYGDLLTTDSKYIAHCVNMQHKMRSGVAKAIRETYPKAYDDYMSSKLQLGKVISSSCNPHTILHIVGQEFYGRDSTKIYVSYRALRSAFRSINRSVTSPVSFPLIGCGLAGGNWNVVKEIMTEEFTLIQPIVYTLNDGVPY